MSVVWYQLYGFLVGRTLDRYGEGKYLFHTYIVLPYGTRAGARRSP